jgi:hypothetical protein
MALDAKDLRDGLLVMHCTEEPYHGEFSCGRIVEDRFSDQRWWYRSAYDALPLEEVTPRLLRRLYLQDHCPVCGVRRGRSKRVHELLHRLWTKAVGTPDYAKEEWMDLEKELS